MARRALPRERSPTTLAHALRDRRRETMVGHCLLLAPSSSQGRSQAISSLSPHAKCPLAPRQDRRPRRQLTCPSTLRHFLCLKAAPAAFNPHSTPPPVRRFSTTGSFGYRPRGGITSLAAVGTPRPPAKRLSALHYVQHDIGWKARFATSALRSTTRSRWQSKRRYERPGGRNGRSSARRRPPRASAVGGYDEDARGVGGVERHEACDTGMRA